MIRARACSPTTATAENKMRKRGARSPLFFTRKAAAGRFVFGRCVFVFAGGANGGFLCAESENFPFRLRKLSFYGTMGKRAPAPNGAGAFPVKIFRCRVCMQRRVFVMRVFVMLLRCARLCRRVPAAAAARVRKVKKGGFNEHLARYFRKAHP